MAKTFKGIRHKTKSANENTTENAALALKQISQTPMGDAIREYLCMISYANFHVKSESAWVEQQAKRLFAEELLQMMDGKPNDNRRSENTK